MPHHIQAQQISHPPFPPFSGASVGSGTPRDRFRQRAIMDEMEISRSAPPSNPNLEDSMKRSNTATSRKDELCKRRKISIDYQLHPKHNDKTFLPQDGSLTYSQGCSKYLQKVDENKVAVPSSDACTSPVLVSSIQREKNNNQDVVSDPQVVGMENETACPVDEAASSSIKGKAILQTSMKFIASSQKKEASLPTLPNLKKSDLQSTSVAEEKKENDDCQEKELVNGALLGLVSLASRSAPVLTSGVKNESKAMKESSNCPSETPSPSQNQQFISTITPSSSTVNVPSMHKNANNRSTSNSPNSTVHNSWVSTCTSEGSDLTEGQAKPVTTLPRGNTSSNHDVAPQSRMPPKHPLSLKVSTPQLSQAIQVPRLDRRSVHTERAYTLQMKRKPEDQFDPYSLEHRYATQDMYEENLGSLQPRMRPRPMRYYSAPNERRGPGFHEYDRQHTPPLSYIEGRPNTVHVPHMEREYKHQIGRYMQRPNEARQHEPELIGQHQEARNPPDFREPPPYVGRRRDFRYVAREDVEERNLHYRGLDRQYIPDDSYYSPPPHQYLPPPQRQYYGPVMQRPLQRIERHNAAVPHHHYMTMSRNHDFRPPQFKCPDGPISTQNSGPPNVANPTPNLIHPNSPYLSPFHEKQYIGALHPELNVKKTILRRKCAWKNYPELEKFLIENREEYLKHSAKNYTIEQKQFNNRLTERLLEVAAKHNYIFDPKDFNFVAVRDRIRCYYKSYVQSNKKRGVIVGYDSTGMKKKQKTEENVVKKEGNETTTSDEKKLDESLGKESEKI